MKRLDQIGIAFARAAASLSKDPSTQVGCALINPETKRLIGVGFNGLPPNIADDERLRDRAWKHTHTIHAEANAILDCAMKGASTSGLYAYVTHSPCVSCATLLIGAGILRVFVLSNDLKDDWSESTEKAISLFNEAQIKFEKI